MRASPIVMCCWPGLPRLWLCGDGFSLSIALAFGGVLNLLLVSVCIRPDWLLWPANLLVWVLVGGFWFVSAARAYRNWPELIRPSRLADDRGLFLKAQSEYLQCHWFEAENALSELVRHSHNDVDARLMLATLYRHTKRFDAATSQLGEIEQFEGAEKWQSEIATERQLIERGRMVQVGVDAVDCSSRSANKASEERLTKMQAYENG